MNAKLVERAKGILNEGEGHERRSAYALLRKAAMNENRRLSEVAQSVVTAAKVTEMNSSSGVVVLGFIPLLDCAPLVAAAEKGSPQTKVST